MKFLFINSLGHNNVLVGCLCVSLLYIPCVLLLLLCFRVALFFLPYLLSNFSSCILLFRSRHDVHQTLLFPFFPAYFGLVQFVTGIPCVDLLLTSLLLELVNHPLMVHSLTAGLCCSRCPVCLFSQLKRYC